MVTLRIAGGTEHPHRTRLPGYIYKMAEVQETVYMHGREVTSTVMVASRKLVLIRWQH
jgi:hypothetical protein